jgi:hypothetical protein
VMRIEAPLTFRLAAVQRRLEKQNAFYHFSVVEAEVGPVAQVVRALC